MMLCSHSHMPHAIKASAFHHRAAWRQRPTACASAEATRRQQIICTGAAATLQLVPGPASAQHTAIRTSGQVQLTTLRDCSLAVSRYPTFAYDAGGGGGQGTSSGDANMLHVKFDVKALNIPPVTSQSAKVLGLPLPPGLRIGITPLKLEGSVNRQTGEVQLQFLAEFVFTAAQAYTAPALKINTLLTTEAVRGKLHGGRGQRLDSSGRARLVGISEVPRTSDAFINSFLTLPSEAYAVLSSRLSFS